MTMTLQQVTDAWGAWLNQQIGGSGNGVRFTSSTSYADHSELAQYMQYQCGATYNNISYATNYTPQNGVVVVPSQTLINDGTVNQTQTFTWSQSTQASFAWSMTEGAKLGVTVSGSASVPLLAEGKVSATVEINFSSTQTTTESNSQAWSVNQPVVVPPHAQMVCQSSINTVTAAIPFTATMLVNGYVAIWFNQQVNGHWLWFYPIGGVLSDVITNQLIDTTGYSVVDNGSILATVNGVCSGTCGINIVTKYTQTPVTADSGLPAETVTIEAQGVVAGAEAESATPAPV